MAEAFSGVIPPMITPLTADGQIDVDGVRRLVAHLISGGVSGIFVLGSSGEGPWLDREQRRRLVEATVRAANGSVPVLAGVLEPGTRRALEALEIVEDAGADAVVITSPYYFGVDSAVQVDHIRTLATSTRLPLVIYNIPPTTHNPILASTIAQVIDLDNLVAVKDSSGDMDNFAQLVALKAVRPDLQILQGAEKLSFQALALGADGCVPGLANLIPAQFVKLVVCTRSGDRAQAQALQGEVNTLWQLHTHGYWLVCLKYAASLMGFGSGRVCSPAFALSDDGKRAIQALLNAQVGAVH